jgi:hypothetical protein
MSQEVPQVAVSLTLAYTDVQTLVNALNALPNSTSTYPILVSIVAQTNAQVTPQAPSADAGVQSDSGDAQSPDGQEAQA